MTKHPNSRAERLKAAHKHKLTHEEKKIRAEARKANKVRSAFREEYKEHETAQELKQLKANGVHVSF